MPKKKKNKNSDIVENFLRDLGKTKTKNKKKTASKKPSKSSHSGGGAKAAPACRAQSGTSGSINNTAQFNAFCSKLAINPAEFTAAIAIALRTKKFRHAASDFKFWLGQQKFTKSAQAPGFFVKGFAAAVAFVEKTTDGVKLNKQEGFCKMVNGHIAALETKQSVGGHRALARAQRASNTANNMEKFNKAQKAAAERKAQKVGGKNQNGGAAVRLLENPQVEQRGPGSNDFSAAN